jgi:GWxTD domain-containing protein
MTDRFGRYLIALTMLCLGAVILWSQPKSILDKTIFVDYGERFHADADVVPSESADSAYVAVFFRISNDFLNFTKVTDPNDIGGNFKAPMAVEIEVRDTVGIIRKRVRWEGTAYTNLFEETNNKNKFHYGWTVFKINEGSYDITLEILAQKESAMKRIKVPTVSFNPNAHTRLLTAPIFAEPVARGGKELLDLYVFSGNISFGSRDARALLMLADKVDAQYEYIIEQLPYGMRDIRWWTVSDVRGTTRSSTTRFPRVSPEATTSDPFLEIREEADNNIPIALVEIPIPVTAMVPGTYALRLIRSGTTDTLSVEFRIVWEMMPLSLRNIDYAMRMMKYILTEDQIDSLDDGSDIERRMRLMDWWRRQDRTLTTTFNERMAEYFRRVDQAFYAFSTIQEPDGASTERGRVFVLYGAPTEITKNLPLNGEPQEVWHYRNKVARIITFAIDEGGRYKIRNVEEISSAGQHKGG